MEFVGLLESVDRFVAWMECEGLPLAVGDGERGILLLESEIEFVDDCDCDCEIFNEGILICEGCKDGVEVFD